MNRHRVFALLLGAAVVIGVVPSAARAEKGGLTVEECVAIALETSATIEEAEAKVQEWAGRLAEVESKIYPIMYGSALIGPVPTIGFGSEGVGGTERGTGFKVQFKKLSDWGPFTSLTVTLAQPLYTFGRLDAGERAASERLEVERARVRETRNKVALEVRKMYYLHLYARSMIPSLNGAYQIVNNAQEQALEDYETGGGEVTQVDLMRLEYGVAELQKQLIRARQGSALALEGLKQLMGWAPSRELVLAERKLSRKLWDEEPELAVLIAEAARKRPEWAQVRHGLVAADSLAEAELLALMPVLALAGSFQASWTPTVEDSFNPYHYDPFNQIFGGVALVLRFDLQPAAVVARRDMALAQKAQVQALARFAATGIPTQVYKAHNELIQARQIAQVSRKGAKATKKWLAFAAAAFVTGTGEASAILEGLVAYLQAKGAEYDSLRAYHSAHAEMYYVVGRARTTD